MVLENHTKFSGKFEVYFFIELEFLKLEFHGKLEFHIFEFQKGSKSLHIFKIVVNYKFFCGSEPYLPCGSCKTP